MTPEQIGAVVGASRAAAGEVLQTLWSGYGVIQRIELEGADVPSVILKRVQPPASESAGHPRGWVGDRSHQRKLRSYAVEAEFYRAFAERGASRLPRAWALETSDDGWSFVLEDLDAAGFPERRGRVSDADVAHCLAWLASFHASFMGVRPDGLWEEGTYWHLATRPDELEAMAHGSLREAAAPIAERLRAATFQTLVHGDAKVANFCFSPDGEVAALDFQYVGGGCGMKDVVYFLSCIGERRCRSHAARFVDGYFDALRGALAADLDADAIEREWRALLPFAWADFERFLAGWAPGHRKRDGHSAAMTRRALEALGEHPGPG